MEMSGTRIQPGTLMGFGHAHLPQSRDRLGEVSRAKHKGESFAPPEPLAFRQEFSGRSKRANTFCVDHSSQAVHRSLDRDDLGRDLNRPVGSLQE